ncbi:TetR/AcrR family transcriptional regulator [Desmospora profundinema]|uniref:AcrR family transcriptional regulator n=1 Tax=Desmospora profundinema TaxID=1571184 RepID=A0ABU1INI4_9BACL|nr:TetR/AcrR family transcriptional regulator [Desmospora profundinema]MDR6226266.1 AcrR family transcriptional regulator [Desmospora profundinema]
MLREQRKKELKEKILLVSLRLFKEKGFEPVTVEEITAACGIAKGTFYNYFSEKKQILLYLGNSQLERLEESVRRHGTVKPFRQRVKKIFGDLLSRYTKHPDIARITISENIRSRLLLHEESRTIEAFQSALSSLVQEAMREGEISDQPDPDQVASTLVGLYFQTLITWLSFTDPEKYDILDIFDNHLEILWEGVGKKD